MAEAVKVAVRVRPFNQREIDRNAKLIIKMDGQLTQITDPDCPTQPPKDFSFDFSYWSHDQFHIDESGVSIADSDKYASQRKVFEDLGQGVLRNAVQGYNCSLFAYGQTGAGKSYSMVGYGPNKGIVPITCDELFKIIENSTTDTKYQVTFSMLEIYNEQVRDLLTKDNPKGGLPVRQNPKIGAFYVQGLKNVAVGSYKEIEQRTEEGTANRTVACTQMNATSSRAHTVVTITFDQIEKNEAGEETKKSSVINLVDLAGSERAESTGATGDRLKEGANINKSLSSLGNVISALADQSSSTKKQKIVVPYRDSVLTKLLKNALGGNSKTIMIAALSPADINYDETLGTLRYADRAKKIKNKAVVNENPMEKLVRELKEENERLKKAMQNGDFSAVDQGLAAGNVESQAIITEEEKADLRKEIEEEIRAQMAANSSAMMNWDDKLEQSRNEIDDTVSKSKQVETVPHFVNLNEDSMLSGVIIHFLSSEETKIGRKDTNPDIAMTGLSISSDHAIIKNNNDEITIKAASPGAKTKVNGVMINGEQKLKHHDRILFGTNHMYYFVNPKNPERVEGTPDTIDWEFANKEIAQAKGFSTGISSGLSKFHAQAMEQVLELLPRVSEANAISEELDKKIFFEVILRSGESGGTGGSKIIEVCVKVTNMVNGNVWLWSRGKFNSRRYVIQDLYQRMLDGDNVSKINPQDDPFWEPPEDMMIGYTNVFLQCLAYALDIDDSLNITDYKGKQEGEIRINITPCNEKGELLDDDYFVEDPKELIGKPYHLTITVMDACIYNPRYKHGIYVTFSTDKNNSAEPSKTPIILNTTSPEFNYKKIISFASVDEELLDWFNNGYLTFRVYAKQNDEIVDTRLATMTTKELRSRMSKQNDGDKLKSLQVSPLSLMKSELILYKRKYHRLLAKEKHIQELVTNWGEKEEKDYDSFYRAMHAAAYHERGMMKYKVNLLQPYLHEISNIPDEDSGKNEKKIINDPAVSKLCSIM